MKYLLILFLLVVGCAKEGPKGEGGALGPLGSVGPVGPKGTSVSTVTFCPNLAGAFPETGIVVDDKIYALYYDGSNPHLSLIPQGNYQTTDGRACNFTVDANNHLL